MPSGQRTDAGRAADRAVRTCPAEAEFGQREVGGELAAPVPDRLSVRVDIAGRGHRVPGQLTRRPLTEPPPHQDTIGSETLEELPLAPRAGGRHLNLVMQGRT